jgi:hypothetical protein
MGRLQVGEVFSRHIRAQRRFLLLLSRQHGRGEGAYHDASARAVEREVEVTGDVVGFAGAASGPSGF